MTIAHRTIRTLAWAGLLLLAACATPEQRAEETAAYIAENYGPTCTKLGYEVGTEGHRNCMLSVYNTDQLRFSAPAWGPYWGPYGWPYGGARYRR